MTPNFRCSFEPRHASAIPRSKQRNAHNPADGRTLHPRKRARYTYRCAHVLVDKTSHRGTIHGDSIHINGMRTYQNIANLVQYTHHRNPSQQLPAATINSTLPVSLSSVPFACQVHAVSLLPSTPSDVLSDQVRTIACLYTFFFVFHVCSE